MTEILFPNDTAATTQTTMSLRLYKNCCIPDMTSGIDYCSTRPPKSTTADAICGGIKKRGKTRGRKGNRKELKKKYRVYAKKGENEPKIE
jgi:hypothetical protein